MGRELIDLHNSTHKLPNKFCCDEMQLHLNRSCNIHTYYACVDNVITHLGRNKYGLIIHDTEGEASSVYRIKFCPWCGKKLGR